MLRLAGPCLIQFCFGFFNAALQSNHSLTELFLCREIAGGRCAGLSPCNRVSRRIGSLLSDGRPGRIVRECRQRLLCVGQFGLLLLKTACQGSLQCLIIAFGNLLPGDRNPFLAAGNFLFQSILGAGL